MGNVKQDTGGFDWKVLEGGGFGSAIVLVDPTISVVTGTLTEGSTLTISGTSFGLGGPILLADTVDNQSAYNATNNGDEIPYSVWEDHVYNYDDIYLETSGGPVGSNKHYRSGAGVGFLSWPTALVGTTQRELYVAWKYKPSEDPEAAGGSNKHMRIWDKNDGTGTRVSWTSMHMTYGPQASTETNWGSWVGNNGQWNLMELWVDTVSGHITASTNGVVVHDVDDFVGFDTDIGLNVREIGFGASNGALYPNMVTELDDIFVNHTRARVELSSSPTWDATSTREIQEISTWVGGEITIDLRKGAIADLESTYIYVINTDGFVNATGYSTAGM